MKNVLNMAIGGLIVAVAYFAKDKVDEALAKSENETLKKYAVYIAPVVVLAVGIVLSFLKNDIIRRIGLMIGTAGVAMLINVLFEVFSKKEVPAAQ